MLVVRPIAMSDYNALHTCAVESGHGFTSLPVNEELLTNRITHSEYSFAKPNVTEPSDEGYLMVDSKHCGQDLISLRFQEEKDPLEHPKPFLEIRGILLGGEGFWLGLQ